MTKPITQSARRKALKSIAGLGACIPCASAFAGTDTTHEKQPVKNFHQRIDTLINQSNASIVRSVNFSITPENFPWTQTLGEVTAGQSVTFLLSGKWWIYKEQNYWVEPGIAFYARVSGGLHYNPSNNTGTMLVDRNGELEIARAVGEFKNPQGELFTPEEHYKISEGLIEGTAIIWQEDARDGLISLSAQGDVEGLVSAEINRLDYQKKVPPGWHYMYMFGDGGIFHEEHEGKLHCNTHKNVGILQYPISEPLEPGLNLNWNWIVEKLPSKVAENQALTHDYLSIAVEFDDGQDITYMWSSELKEGEVFKCPLPRWTEIETHVVQRSGKKHMGQILKESRNIFDDYKTIIGGEARSITRIWLIANSVFMRESGRCSYSDISLTGKDSHRQIL